MKMVSNLRAWCYEILESGAPGWSRSKLMMLIGKCNKLTADFKEDVKWLAWYEDISESEARKLLRHILLWGHENHDFFYEVRGCRPLLLEGEWTIIDIILWISLNLGKKAPSGWHARLMRIEVYRRMWAEG